MMKIVPLKMSQQVESTHTILDSMEKELKPKFFSVDRNQRWPVQGWTSGNRYILNAESAEELAEEAKRAFTVNRKSRWPLQGWCKAPTVDHSSAEGVPRASKYGAQSRWPQGW